MKQLGWIIISIMSFSFGLSAQDSTLSKAQNFIQAADYFAALQLLNPLVKEQPKNAEALYWRAYSYLKLEKYDLARGNFLLAIKNKSGYHEAYAGLGVVFAETKQYPESLKAFDTAIDFWKFSPEYFNYRGNTKYNLQKYQAAFFDFDQAIKLDSNFALAYNNRGSARYNNNAAKATFEELSRAEADYDKCLSLAPNFQIALRNRGVVRYHLGKFNEAYKDLKQASQLITKDAIAFYHLGKVLDKLDQIPLAKNAFQQALELNPKMGDVYIDRAWIFIKLEDFGNAIMDFELALESPYSDKGKIYTYIAEAYAAQGKKTEMLAALKNAQKLKHFKFYPEKQALQQNKIFDKYKSDPDFKKWYDGVMK